MNCSTSSFPVLHHLLQFAQTQVHWVDGAIHPSHPLSPPSFPALNLSQHQGLFQWVGTLHQVAKVLELQHQSFQWILGLISFKIHWFDIIAVQGTLKSLLQHHNSKAWIFQCSALFVVQLSHFYMATGNTIALLYRPLLVFSTLSRFFVAFLPRSIFSWLQSPSAVILEPRKRKSVTVSTFSPSICPEVTGQDAIILVFWMLF